MTLASMLHQPPRAPASLPDWALNNPEWWSALHILTAPLFANDARVWAHIDLGKRFIDCYSMLDQGWSTGERVMVEVACVLYHGDLGEDPCERCERDRSVDVRALCGTLTASNFVRVVEALCIRRESPIPPAVEAAS